MITFDYPVSIDHFRAFMKSLLISWTNKRESIWTSNYQEKLSVYYQSELHIPKRDVWGILLLQPMEEKGQYQATKKRAAIMALETYPNKTTVTFVDGKYYYSFISDKPEFKV